MNNLRNRIMYHIDTGLFRSAVERDVEADGYDVYEVYQEMERMIADKVISESREKGNEGWVTVKNWQPYKENK